MKQQGIVLNEDISYQATCTQEMETFEVITTVRVAQKSGMISPNELDASFRRACDELYGALARAYGIGVQTTPAPDKESKPEKNESKPEISDKKANNKIRQEG